MREDRETHAPHSGVGDPGVRGVVGPAGTTQRPRLNRRDVFLLILAAYKTAFPYFLLFVLVMLIATWLLTEFAFKP